jgi:hypothetical protein
MQYLCILFVAILLLSAAHAGKGKFKKSKNSQHQPPSRPLRPAFNTTTIQFKVKGNRMTFNSIRSDDEYWTQKIQG